MDRLARELAALGAETRTERRVKRIVPWVASLVIHLGMATLAVFITWTVSNLPKKDDAVLIVADFNALNYEPVAGMESAPGQPAGPVVRDMAPPLPVAQHINDQLNAPDDQPLKDVAAALGYADESGVSALSRFAPRPGQNAAIFAGASGSNARRIVYVIDASGSMIAYLQIVVDELARSLENLSSRQSFGVVFFQADAAIQVPPAGELLPATADEKVRALKWIDANIVPAGGTNPVVAIDKALALKPNVIFLLSQDITGYGQFEVDQQDLLTMLDQRNPREAQTGRRAVQINCIQFLDHDPLETMAKIAKEHGGPNGYKFLTRKELGLGES
jgi:hypothetical protein